MEKFQIYILLLGIIVVVGQLFRKSTIPIALLLVMAGMVLSFFPHFPKITLNSSVVLNIFLPILIYQISAFFPWKNVKKNMRPITLMSVGHVVFITILVAVIIHALIPELGWPLAFVLGAVISPPDDVAIVSIAEKIRMPERILVILEGEGMLNDATALILFRLALVAVVTHEFSIFHAVSSFIIDVVGETLYGLALGYMIGEFRRRLSNSMLHLIASFITPFLAYLPPEHLGGSGILATVVIGFVIGHIYSERASPEFRLVSRAVWPALAFLIQGILFLLVGLNFHSVLKNISTIATPSLILYGIAVVLAVIIGRFIWVYGAVIYLPRLLVLKIRKYDPTPRWQVPFVISWAGMRGAISLAAALAIPALPMMADGSNPKDLIIYLVFCVIIATLLLQGLTLPWILKVTGLKEYGQTEERNQYHAELKARLMMAQAVLRWLSEYMEQIKDDEKLLNEAKLRFREYRLLKKKLKAKIGNHEQELVYDERAEAEDEYFILTQIIEIEKTELSRLWHQDKVNLAVRNKLLDRLDHRFKHLS